MNDAQRDALQRIVAEQPGITVADLRGLVAERPSLGGVTLAELLGGTPAAPAAPRRGRGRPPKKQSAAKPKPAAAIAKPEAKKPAAAAKAGGGKKWDTRTEQGREALDRAVMEALSALGGVSVGSEAIRDRLGATPAQIRTSLNRHIEAGDVTFTGKARGTRYTLAK